MAQTERPASATRCAMARPAGPPPTTRWATRPTPRRARPRDASASALRWGIAEKKVRDGDAPRAGVGTGLQRASAVVEGEQLRARRRGQRAQRLTRRSGAVAREGEGACRRGGHGGGGRWWPWRRGGCSQLRNFLILGGERWRHLLPRLQRRPNRVVERRRRRRTALHGARAAHGRSRQRRPRRQHGGHAQLDKSVPRRRRRRCSHRRVFHGRRRQADGPGAASLDRRQIKSTGTLIYLKASFWTCTGVKHISQASCFYINMLPDVGAARPPPPSVPYSRIWTRGGHPAICRLPLHRCPQPHVWPRPAVRGGGRGRRGGWAGGRGGEN
uniref:Uncharacterized protein n=1 Tax=Oryza sativa subsp. japonica TaxID=39947 RepID=Q9AUN3_ORYSJ|nr:Hypothetical protein [Oryza sativa Japonica Group]